MSRNEKIYRLMQKVVERRAEIKKFFSQDLLLMSMIVFLFLSVAYYLAGVNDLIVKGHELKRLKREVTRLSEENKDFESEITLLESYNEVGQRVRNLNMVKADKIEYIMVNGGALAKR